MSYTLATLPPNPAIETWIRDMEGLSFLARRRVLRGFTPEPISRFLYKYHPCNSPYSLTNLRDTILGSVLRLSSTREFNDPFELAAHFVMTATDEQKRERYEALIRAQAPHLGWRAIQAHIATLMARTLDEFTPMWQQSLAAVRDAAGIYCFAGKASNRLMWGHYASNHKGVCLQFERVLDIRRFSHALRVKYVNDLPAIDFVVSFHSDINRMLLRKDPCWEYERESRILIMDQAGRYLPFLPQALRGVIFGCRAEVGFVEEVEKLLAERTAAGMPPVQVYRAHQHPTKYHLVVKRK